MHAQHAENPPDPELIVSEDWLTIEEVKKELGIATRTVQQWANEDLLRWKRLNLGKRGRVYDAAQVAYYKLHGAPRRRREKEPGEPAGLGRPAAQKEPGEALATRKRSPELAELALAVREATSLMLAPKPIPPAEKLWLSLDEAAAYSGLARSDLRKLCRMAFTGLSLNGLIVRRSGGWKIQRKSLEDFEGSSFEGG